VRTDCDLRRDVSAVRVPFAHVRIVAFEKSSVKHNTRCLLSFVDRVPVKRTFTTQQSRAAEELSARFQDARNFRIMGADALSFSGSAIRKTEVDPESRIFHPSAQRGHALPTTVPSSEASLTCT